jgi:hypothetical protein
VLYIAHNTKANPAVNPENKRTLKFWSLQLWRLVSSGGQNQSLIFKVWISAKNEGLVDI